MQPYSRHGLKLSHRVWCPSISQPHEAEPITPVCRTTPCPRLLPSLSSLQETGASELFWCHRVTTQQPRSLWWGDPAQRAITFRHARSLIVFRRPSCTFSITRHCQLASRHPFRTRRQQTCRRLQTRSAVARIFRCRSFHCPRSTSVPFFHCRRCGWSTDGAQLDRAWW